MLDLNKIVADIAKVSKHLQQEAISARHRIDQAQQTLLKAIACQDELIKLRQEWNDRLGFAIATPIEPLDYYPMIPVAPSAQTVIATDGSQIAPSHHEIAYCYLINIGMVVLHYGQNKHPLLDTQAEIFYEKEDLYQSKQWGISTEEWMSHRRTVTEITMLSDLAINLASSLDPAIPILALTDGSLIYWFLEELPSAAQELILNPILKAWTKLQEAQIPILGYLSAARNQESLNFLRLPHCKFTYPDCISHCTSKTDFAPCQVYEQLRDTTFWSLILPIGHRSPLWQSSARILQQYSHHQIYFCYLNVGSEIARIEVPQWVAHNSKLLDLALAQVLSQVHKGHGYPIALSEAHHQAVVKKGDRFRFFALLEQYMIRAGIKNVGVSYKENRKRGSIA